MLESEVQIYVAGRMGIKHELKPRYNTRIGVDPSGPDPVIQQATLRLDSFDLHLPPDEGPSARHRSRPLQASLPCAIP